MKPRIYVFWYALWFAAGCLAISLGLLPDLYPELAAWPPHLAALDVGFARLGKLGVLRIGDQGYEGIYQLLRHFDPSIPSFESNLASVTQMAGRILAQREVSYSVTDSIAGKSNKELSMLYVVLFQRVPEGTWPVCEMRDLSVWIQAAKVRFWTRVGFGLSLLSLFLEGLPPLVEIAAARQRDPARAQDTRSSALRTRARRVPQYRRNRARLSRRLIECCRKER